MAIRSSWSPRQGSNDTRPVPSQDEIPILALFTQLRHILDDLDVNGPRKLSTSNIKSARRFRTGIMKLRRENTSQLYPGAFPGSYS